MRMRFVTAALLAATAACPAALAQPLAPAPAGAYGGGFIELLMSGREPSEVAPYSYGGMPAAPLMRRGERPSGYRVASLPQEPEADSAIGIGRAMDKRFARQTVPYGGPHGPGTVVIDTPSKFLYLVQPGGHAIRYGIGVGRPGFTWAGVKTVSMKRTWPDWTPPAQMLQRRPDLPRHMEGGPANPLGARALYLGSSLYRIHGTNEPHTIGQNVSSGCIRMMNADVADLYERVPVGTKVVVR